MFCACVCVCVFFLILFRSRGNRFKRYRRILKAIRKWIWLFLCSKRYLLRFAVQLFSYLRILFEKRSFLNDWAGRRGEGGGTEARKTDLFIGQTRLQTKRVTLRARAEPKYRCFVLTMTGIHEIYFAADTLIHSRHVLLSRPEPEVQSAAHPPGLSDKLACCQLCVHNISVCSNWIMYISCSYFPCN